LALLSDDAVKKDLGITDDQTKKLEEFQTKVRTEMGTLFQGLRNLSQEERTAKFQELQKKSAEMTAAAEKEILLPKQIERLKQISVQSRLSRSNTSDALASEELSKDLSNRFFLLARRFWPGPLTLIVPASEKVPLKVTGNTGRLALRQSRSAVANALVAALGQSLISTSANISGHPTCRSGIEVFGMMDGRVDLVLDGGVCAGAGATTVDVTEPAWKLIKQGVIGEKEISECLQAS